MKSLIIVVQIINNIYDIVYNKNTNTNEKIEGSEYSKSFVEFWKFKRNDKDNWVLDKIKQKDEI